ncbi:hypothetical protein NDU88_000803 [Pleurodeles waltl]|uniref:Uncharacterized protein n=1 Tax=Pleurodeles waltl TaxID=8319 RepID=A0AAV7LZ60_PLEWA|nr:hypothetical protein NDU88_000803 [Pleurodeles waltl]
MGEEGDSAAKLRRGANREQKTMDPRKMRLRGTSASAKVTPVPVDVEACAAPDMREEGDSAARQRREIVFQRNRDGRKGEGSRREKACNSEAAKNYSNREKNWSKGAIGDRVIENTVLQKDT